VDASGTVIARYVYQDGEGAKQNGMHQLATRLGANQDTSLPFAGSNVPEFIELLNGAGTVTQRLRLIVNQVGTVQAVVDASTGEVVQRLEHDEFGRVLFDSSPDLQPFGFAGGLVDADTGLVRFGARDYEPIAGRWPARDPVRFAGRSLNVYSYVDGEPTQTVDLSGLWGVAVGQGLGGGFAVGGDVSVGIYIGNDGDGWYGGFFTSLGTAVRLGGYAGGGPSLSVFSCLGAFVGESHGGKIEGSLGPGRGFEIGGWGNSSGSGGTFSLGPQVGLFLGRTDSNTSISPW
jgi:RHS repeat-associated protein